VTGAVVPGGLVSGVFVPGSLLPTSAPELQPTAISMIDIAVTTIRAQEILLVIICLSKPIYPLDEYIIGYYQSAGVLCQSVISPIFYYKPV
jgi:hypothetical protein